MDMAKKSKLKLKLKRDHSVVKAVSSVSVPGGGRLYIYNILFLVVARIVYYINYSELLLRSLPVCRPPRSSVFIDGDGRK